MADTQQFTIKKYVSDLKSVIRSDAQSSLGSALSLVRSSHEAVFIFKNDDEFLGLISPFKTLYSSNYPYTTKVSSIVFKPPTITEDTPVYEVAEHMLGTKIYTLPVFGKNGSLSGVVHGKRIMQGILKDSGLSQRISENVKPHAPLTVSITSSVREVFHALKERGVSRMIVVGSEGDLVGIVTRSDLMHSLIRPTAKMRFPSEGTHVGYYSLAGEKKFRKDEPIRKYYTVQVDSVTDTTSNETIIRHLISSPYNSVVIVDGRKKPTGFLSTRDILQSISLLRPEDKIPLIIKKPSNSVSDEELEQATEYLRRFGGKLKKRMEVEKIEIASDEPKKQNGETKAFNTTLIVTPVAGKAFVAVTKQGSFIDGIQEATAIIEKQRRRSDVSKQ